MIRLRTEAVSPLAARCDALVAFVFEAPPGGAPVLYGEIAGVDIPAPEGTGFRGKERETLLLFPKEIASGRLLLVGAGAAGAWSAERVRRAGATAARALRAMGIRRAAVMEPERVRMASVASGPGEDAAETFASALAEGILLALYRYVRYQTQKTSPPDRLTEVQLLAASPHRRAAYGRGIRYALVVCEATMLARDLENAPANEITPEALAAAARAAGRSAGFSVRVLGTREIRALGMGGLLAVGAGSRHAPRFLVMEYRPAAARGSPPLVLIGKGITFDSGGISIKPSAGMAEMKMDMSGGAAVIGALRAAARLRLPLRLVGLVPAAENLPGGAALRPGDILRHYNGMTSEVDNTDAEGRLVLADALGFASRYRPSLVIDLATLTGAVVVALGHVVTGMMGNDPEGMRLLKEAGERTYERVWELPLYEEYETLIKSDVADVKNTGGRWGGAITAAMFLKKFTGSYKWIHLDIAGTAVMEEAGEYTPKGGSGVGVRLLADFLRRWAHG